ncbi:hypothetical protein GIB67_035778 [Kingdonia uniflora]|uniref:Uncharacterized protein n=1 Tax=Kingdonia uniflora TaxID=39325 RepID=A0A7J7MJI6_9MAGN|nr:hypothetical protein GIB67_035778 [Kingdonia uniflora]
MKNGEETKLWFDFFDLDYEADKGYVPHDLTKIIRRITLMRLIFILFLKDRIEGLDTAITTGGAITGFVQLLPYWFYEYCGVGYPIVKEEVTGEVRIPLDPPLSMSPHISPAALHEMRYARFVDYSQRMGNLDLFRPSTLRAGITPVVVTSTSIHSLSQNFSLPDEAKGPDLGWNMKWTGRQSAWDAQRFQKVEDELVIARRQIDSIAHQLYAHDLQLRRRRDVRVVPLPPGGGARTRQRGSGPRTRGGNTSRRGQGTGDDSE